MDRACGTHEVENKSVQALWKNVQEKSHIENLGVDGKVVLKQIINKRDGMAQTALILVQGREKL